MPTSRLASSMLNPRTWLLCAAAVALAGGCNDSSGLNLKGDAGVDAQRGTDAKTGTDTGVTCEQAGGSCVAVYPGTCASGTVVSYSCGSGVGTECCMPGGNGGANGTGGSAGSGGRSGTGGSAGSGGSAGTGGIGGSRGSGGSAGTGGATGVACEKAGGSCVAVYPGSCASGTVVAISCGPGIGAECCMLGGNGGASGTGGTRGSGGSSGTGGQTGMTCQQAGGSCVAVYPGACVSGLVVDFSCGGGPGGVGSECCMPGGSHDAGIDSGSQKPAELCTATGGVVKTGQCCASASDFPQTCSVGACSCAPSSSKTISLCDCGTGCFSPTVGCVAK